MVLLDVDGTGLCDDLLTLGVVVVQRDTVDRELLHVVQQHKDDAGSVGAATSRYGDGVALLAHI